MNHVFLAVLIVMIFLGGILTGRGTVSNPQAVVSPTQSELEQRIAAAGERSAAILRDRYERTLRAFNEGAASMDALEDAELLLVNNDATAALYLLAARWLERGGQLK